MRSGIAAAEAEARPCRSQEMKTARHGPVQGTPSACLILLQLERTVLLVLIILMKPKAQGKCYCPATF